MQESARRSAVWAGKVEASKTGAADKGYVGHKAAKMMKRSKTAAARAAYSKVCPHDAVGRARHYLQGNYSGEGYKTVKAAVGNWSVS